MRKICNCPALLAIVDTVAFFYSKISPIFVSNKTRHASGSHAHPVGLVQKRVLFSFGFLGFMPVWLYVERVFYFSLK